MSGTSRAGASEGGPGRAAAGGSLLWRQRLSAQCWDPQLAEHVLARVAEFCPDLETVFRQSPQDGVNLLNFLFFSPVSFEKICRSPELLLWLPSPEVLYFKEGEGQRKIQAGPAP